jgi:peptidoglycan/LPS O-acetylase OafA/YrhL
VLRNVQALRALAALLVICVHVGSPNGFEARYLHVAAPLLAATVKIGYSGVDLFFVISGFIMVVTTMGLRAAPTGSQFFLLRLVRIFPLLWIVTGLVFLVSVLRPGLVNSHGGAVPSDVLASFLALPQSGTPLLLVSWSLTYEMYFYSVFALALALGRASMGAVLAFWGVATLALNFAFGASSNPWLHVAANPVCFEFLLGAAVGLLAISDRFVAPATWLGVGVLGFAAQWSGGLPDGWWRVLGALPFALILYGAVGLERTGSFVFPRFLDRLGDASYATYLIHVPVFALYGLIVSRTPQLHASRIEDGLALALGFVLVEGFALAIYRSVERPMSAILRAAVLARRRAVPVLEQT